MIGFLNGQADVEEMKSQKVLTIKMYESLGMDKASLEDTLLILDKTNEHFYLNYSTSIVFGIIGFFAVLQIYRLQKMGFWMYIAYSLIPIAVSFYILEGVESRMSSMTISLFVSSVFIALYASQLKRLS